MSPVASSMRPVGFYLALQILTAIAAPFIFQYIQPRQVAALVAGAGFIIQGVAGILFYLWWSGGTLNRIKKSLGYWVTLVHLFLVSLPMVVVRIQTWGQEFSTVTVMGIPGPEFHKVGGLASTLLFVATLVDFWWLRRQIVRN